MEVIDVQGDVFLKDYIKGANFIFSTGEKGLDININNINAKKELLIDHFSLKDIGYIRQCHSDTVGNYNGEVIIGDGLIGHESLVALGVFTADCVPILICDIKKQAVAAIHSGWKGTYNNIVVKAIEKLIKDEGSLLENIIIYIGPHIKSCCYEVSEDLKRNFINKGFSSTNFDNRNLSLSSCIKDSLLNIGVNKDNIYEAQYCTRCSKDIKFNSYRRDGEHSGRNYSFVFFS